MTATIHFMHGFIGYGKSTLAKKINCKRISMDDVYSELNNGRAAIIVIWYNVYYLLTLSKNLIFKQN